MDTETEKKLEDFAVRLEEILNASQKNAAAAHGKWKAFAIAGIWVGLGFVMLSIPDGLAAIIAAGAAVFATAAVAERF